MFTKLSVYKEMKNTYCKLWIKTIGPRVTTSGTALSQTSNYTYGKKGKINFLELSVYGHQYITKYICIFNIYKINMFKTYLRKKHGTKGVTFTKATGK